MPQAIWHDAIIAESDDIELVKRLLPDRVSENGSSHESTATVPTYCH